MSVWSNEVCWIATLQAGPPYMDRAGLSLLVHAAGWLVYFVSEMPCHPIRCKISLSNLDTVIHSTHSPSFECLA